MLWQDPIIEEIHQIRKRHTQRFNYDIWEIYKDLKTKESVSEWKKVSCIHENNHEKTSPTSGG